MNGKRKQNTNHLLNIRNPPNLFAHTKGICFSLCAKETVWLLKTRISVLKLIPLQSSSPAREGCSPSHLQRAKISVILMCTERCCTLTWPLRNENYNCKANSFRKYIQKVTSGWLRIQLNFLTSLRQKQ